MNSTSEVFKNIVDELRRRSEWGDEFATQCLACMELLSTGWRYGDPDPEDDGGGPDPGEPLPMQRAA